MKKIIHFILPIISFSAASIICFVLMNYCVGDTITESAMYGISIVLCIIGSFLCGFLAFGDSGLMGMILTAFLVVSSVLLWIIVLLAESSVLSYLLSGFSYFFVFICVDINTPLSAFFDIILPFDITIIRLFFLSIVVPIVFIIIGFKLRLKCSKRLLDK